MGLGLWNYPALALSLEAILLFGGMFMYLRRTKPVSAVGRFGPPIFGLLIPNFLTSTFETFQGDCFILVAVEDSHQLCHHHQIFQAITQLHELQIATASLQASVDSNQTSEPARVHLAHAAEVQEHARATVLDQLLYRVA
jgi:hypothetical protein